MTKKSAAEVVYILLDKYDANITLVMSSQQCQPCRQNDLAGRTPLASQKKGRPSARTHSWDTYSRSRAYKTIRVQMVHVEIVSMVNRKISQIQDKSWKVQVRVYLSGTVR